MPQGLWVEHKIDKETYIHMISIEGCELVANFIDRVRSNPQLCIPKDLRITLHGPSGTAISVGDPISSLVPGNSLTNPLHVQISVAI